MITHTNYANQKYELLNRHQVFFRQEQVEEAVTLPDSVKKRGKYFFAQKNNIKVVYKPEGEIKRIITFYPVK